MCGIVAQGKGLTLGEAVLMSATVYAGSAHLLALSQWGTPAPILAVTLAALIVNLRMVMMGPVIGVWLDRIRGWRLWLSLFVMADQNWAMSVREIRRGRGDAGFLFGSGGLMWVVWVIGTGVGHVIGSTMAPAPGHPLFFAALGVFVAVLAGMWQGRSDLLPWAVAAGVALLVAQAVGGSWYIVAGAVAGAIAGVLRDRWRGGTAMRVDR